MERAIALARRCDSEPGRVSPKVGAVVVRAGVVLGEAFRGELSPGDHAEFTLLETKLCHDMLAGATLPEWPPRRLHR
jgi:pyrimidine deaminase RibD-like protein